MLEVIAKMKRAFQTLIGDAINLYRTRADFYEKDAHDARIELFNQKSLTVSAEKTAEYHKANYLKEHEENNQLRELAVTLVGKVKQREDGKSRIAKTRHGDGGGPTTEELWQEIVEVARVLREKLDG